MDIGAGSTRVTDLDFQVYSRTIHPDWYCVRAFKRIVLSTWEVDLRVIHGGHAIHWTVGDTQVSEVLTATEWPLPQSHVAYCSKLRQEQSFQFSPGPATSYQSCYSVERLAAPVFRQVAAELELVSGRNNGLTVHTAARSRLNPSALSRIDVDATHQRLCVTCFHTFPDEQAIVRTQSLFELARLEA